MKADDSRPQPFIAISFFTILFPKLGCFMLGAAEFELPIFNSRVIVGEMSKMPWRLSEGNHYAAKRFLPLVLLVWCGALDAYAANQRAEDHLTERDKSEIISSILEEEWQPAPPGPLRGFHVDRYLSRENIVFYELSLSLAEGFKLIEAAELREKLKGDDFECLIFKGFNTAGDGKVAVRVSRIDAAFSCYGGYITSRRELIYEYRKLSGRWAGTLINTSPHQAL
jgi:hypothetical protein